MHNYTLAIITPILSIFTTIITLMIVAQKRQNAEREHTEKLLKYFHQSAVEFFDLKYAPLARVVLLEIELIKLQKEIGVFSEKLKKFKSQ